VQVLDDPTKPFDDVATSYVERFSRDGVAIGGRLTLDAGPAKGHRLGVGRDGAVVVAYLQMAANELTGEIRTGEVHFRRVTVAGSRLAGAELFVNGGEGNDHIIVERVRQNLFVNINGIVERFNAADVQFLSISGLGGDDDIVNASAIPSTVSGGDGADTLWGGTGPDRLRGFGANDVLRGGDGTDTLFGDTGSDVVLGGDDQDLLLGDAGEDTLLGSSGNDTLRGHRGSDRLFGEAGNDTLDGGDADDYLEGGAEHDQLDGGAGRDALFGLAGNDRFFTNDGAADTVRGGVGDDRADADGLDDVLAVESLS